MPESRNPSVAMHLDLSDADAEFLADVRAFITRHWPPSVRRPRPVTAPDGVPGPAENAWFRALAARGWAVPHWPPEHGGTCWPAARRYLWARETALAEAPDLDPCGVQLVGPLICALGSIQQQRRWLPGIREARARWCLAWSEPEAGSDLSRVATRAEPSAAGYRLTGMKSWVAGARHAGAMLCLARTGGAPEPAGLSLFLLDVSLPGVRVEPIVTLDGSAGLANVDLDGVDVPAAALLGPRDGALEVLARLDQLGPAEPVLAPRLQVHVERLKSRAAGDQDLARQAAALEVEVAGLEALELRILSQQDEGRRVPALVAMRRLRQVRVVQRLGELQVAALGHYALPFPDVLLIDNEGPIGHDYALVELADMLRGRSWSIDGGTSELHKNRIAGTILGF
jgi:alkylation response protein AidB-like acyl-CoA dehydrogenase